MFVLVANKLACARLRDLLHQKLRTILLGVATSVPKVARNNDAPSIRAFITSTDEIHLTLMMTSAQVVETSVNVITTGPSQDYTYPDDHNLPTYDVTPGFKPSTVLW